MTVQDLIDRLQKVQDRNMPVYVSTDNIYKAAEVSRITLFFPPDKAKPENRLVIVAKGEKE